MDHSDYNTRPPDYAHAGSNDDNNDNNDNQPPSYASLEFEEPALQPRDEEALPQANRGRICARSSSQARGRLVGMTIVIVLLILVPILATSIHPAQTHTPSPYPTSTYRPNPATLNCAYGLNYTTSLNHTYAQYCGIDWPISTTVTSVNVTTAYTFQDCMLACDQYNLVDKLTFVKCWAVTYTATTSTGLASRNCNLKTARGGYNIRTSNLTASAQLYR